MSKKPYNWAEWSKVEHLFKGTLLLGNGASQAISQNFSYTKLFDKAVELEFINNDIKNIFQEFETQDFELVLRYLRDSLYVASHLKIEQTEIKKIEDAYEKVKNALIHTVQKIHINYDSVRPNFDNIGSFTKSFRNIVSLNYDLLLYWVILYENDKEGKDPYFKDGFKGKFLHENFSDRLYEPYQPRNEISCSLVVYPHGSLFLTSSKSKESEKKIINDPDSVNLLDSIIKQWESEQEIPLFVSEATSKQKKEAIHHSEYLSRVYYEVLPYLVSTPNSIVHNSHDQSLLIYGWSMSEQDTHIIDQIKKNTFGRIGVSIYTDGFPNNFAPEEFCNSLCEKIRNISSTAEIYFISSVSLGFWNNSPYPF
jgi:hypothetical protein